MKRCVLLIGVMLFSLLASACGGGGGGNPTQPGSFSVFSAPDGTVGVHGGPGSADAGTTVSLDAPATGSGTAAADGSVDFKGTSGGANSVSVLHKRGGTDQTATASVVAISTRVDAHFASTAAAPNDLKLGNNSLYVACALDNKVQRFSLDGSLNQEQLFPVASSPSYLALSQNGTRLYVVRNGDDLCTALDALTLENFTPALERDYGPPTIDFLGPGSSVAVGERVITPVATIQTFGNPTVYGSGHVDVVDFSDGGGASAPDLSGKNGQAVALSPDNTLVYVTSAGEVQFDDQFHPSVTTSSFLSVFPASINDDADAALQELDLGLIGASSIAVSPDGKTAYLGNLLDGKLYKVDLESMTVLRGHDNPIELSSEFTFISDVAFTPDGRKLLATSFNTDELFVVDTATDTISPAPYPGAYFVGLDSSLLSGTAGVETNGFKAWVFYSIGNGIGEVDLL